MSGLRWFLKIGFILTAEDRLDDVEAKLTQTDKEAEKARKTSKDAREEFNKVKKKR